MSNTQDPNDLRYHYGRVIRLALNTIAVTTTLLFLVLAVMVNYDGIRQYFADKAAQKAEAEKAAAAAQSGSQLAVTSKGGFWNAPDINSIADPGKKIMVSYGRELIAHTAKYLGPNGSVMQISNGMNCQNCHLDAGTKVFGNNYGSVASLYPKFRPRSGSIEDIYKRVNDCFQRSLNGQALDTLGKEMQAIKAYIEFLGSNVPKGEKAEGSGFKDLAFLDRAADPAKGKQVYLAKCVSCHQPDGQGTLLADKSEYSFPPLWGPSSYNDAAGLFRVSNFAKYVKYNMPLGATHENTQLTDEEAWDVAAFVNSQPRPHKHVPQDWPDISKKPIDHPFGPYADKFSERQHKFGPFKPIQEERKKGEAAGKNKGKTS